MYYEYNALRYTNYPFLAIIQKGTMSWQRQLRKRQGKIRKKPTNAECKNKKEKATESNNEDKKPT